MFKTKPNNFGKFIVIEGIDGAGGETQSSLLADVFRKTGLKVEKITYPDYEGPMGKVIHDFLHYQHEFSPEVQFLLYFTDFLKDKEKIENCLKEGRVVVSDRYFTSTIAYQCQKGFSLERALELAQNFQLPKPDLVL